MRIHSQCIFYRFVIVQSNFHMFSFILKINYALTTMQINCDVLLFLTALVKRYFNAVEKNANVKKICEIILMEQRRTCKYGQNRDKRRLIVMHCMSHTGQKCECLRTMLCKQLAKYRLDLKFEVFMNCKYFLQTNIRVCAQNVWSVKTTEAHKFIINASSGSFSA